MFNLEKGLIFSEAKFANKANFSETEFRDEADFSRAEFIEKAYFNETQFCNSAYFSEAKFSSKVDLSWAEFGNGAYFSQAQFNDEINFYMCVFKGDARFVSTEFNNESFINFEYTKFNKPKDVWFHNIDLGNVSFINTDVYEVDFSNEIGRKKKDMLVVVDESRIGKDEFTTYGAVAQLYRRLRRNYETNYRFAEAGDFFIGEMEMRRHDVNPEYRRF